MPSQRSHQCQSFQVALAGSAADVDDIGRCVLRRDDTVWPSAAADRADPHAWERAIDIAREDPPAWVSPDAAAAEVRDVLNSVGDK